MRCSLKHTAAFDPSLPVQTRQRRISEWCSISSRLCYTEDANQQEKGPKDLLHWKSYYRNSWKITCRLETSTWKLGKIKHRDLNVPFAHGSRATGYPTRDRNAGMKIIDGTALHLEYANFIPIYFSEFIYQFLVPVSQYMQLLNWRVSLAIWARGSFSLFCQKSRCKRNFFGGRKKIVLLLHF